jgi:hypothetical protein
MKKGRPTLSDSPMMDVVPVRMAPEMLAEIRKITEAGQTARVTQSQVIRDLLAQALAQRRRRK